MWKVFATAYPSQFRTVAPYRAVKIREPQMSLRDYLGLIRSESLSWRTMLVLDTSIARVPELVEIASVKNLVALEITTPRNILSVTDNSNMRVASLSDRIVRTWSELAESSGAFSQLRILRLYNQHDVSSVILRYLGAFPSLCLVIAQDCSNLIASLPTKDLHEDGWEMGYPRFGADVEQGDVSEALTLYERYKASLAPEIDGRQARQEILIQDCPVLDFRLGKDPSAGPKTRHNAKPRSTIYLQRRRSPESRPLEPVPKRQKLAGKSVHRTSQPSSGPKKPVMKQHKTRDLGDVLGDFL